MAVYVPISSHTTSNAVLTSVESYLTAYNADATALSNATASALASKTSALALLNSQFSAIFLVGA